jgi:hypothetical protein
LSIFDDESFAEDPVFAVVGKKRDAEILNASGSVVLKALMRGVTASNIEYTNVDGSLAGNLKINSAVSKRYMELSLANGGALTVVRHGGSKQSYAVLEDDVAVLKMDLMTLTPQRSYPVDISGSVDLPLAVGLVWAINFAHLREAYQMSGGGAG